MLSGIRKIAARISDSENDSAARRSLWRTKTEQMKASFAGVAACLIIPMQGWHVVAQCGAEVPQWVACEAIQPAAVGSVLHPEPQSP